MATLFLICRICLSVNVKMYNVKNTGIENLYKLLTQAYVDVEDGKPATVCFLCYGRLRQCDRLQRQAIKSNELLEQLLRGGFMQATANAIVNNQYTSQDLQVSSIYHLSCEPATCEDVFLDQNVKANSQISVKEENEAIDEGYYMIDFPEDANDSKDYDPVDDQPLIGSNKSDEIEEIVYENKRRKLQENENLCENNPSPSSSTQIIQKENVSKNNEKANGIHFKSKRKLDKTITSFVQGAEGIKINLKRKMEKTKTTFIPKELYIQKRNNNKDTSEKPFACNICGYRCANRVDIVRHLRTHTGEKPFSCHICEYKCVKKNQLKVHMRRHTGEKPFSCNICEYRCSHKSYLKDHIRTHTGEKPFSCKICQYRCAQKSRLKTHTRKHTGDKPFSCYICEYRCSQKPHLKDHIKTHTGEKPFSCNICQYRCTQKSQLKTHTRKHTGEKPFSCNICEYKCTRKLQLKKHLEKHN